jgi:ABC-type proline/glycine betaine transport system permease subunit
MPSSGVSLMKLLVALGQTLPLTLAGMALGIVFAFALALMSVLRPGIIRGFMPVALVTQTMPLVALTPLLVLMLGRGPSVILFDQNGVYRAQVGLSCHCRYGKGCALDRIGTDPWLREGECRNWPLR